MNMSKACYTNNVCCNNNLSALHSVTLFYIFICFYSLFSLPRSFSLFLFLNFIHVNENEYLMDGTEYVREFKSFSHSHTMKI